LSFAGRTPRPVLPERPMAMSRPVIALSGDLDIYGAKAACRVLDTIQGPAVVDLSAVAFLDGTGLSELVRLARRVGAGTVVLVVPSAQMRRVFEIVRFGELFRIVERLDEGFAGG
jgi:anti-anti-sigma factor